MKNKVWIASGLAFSLINSTLTASAGDLFRNDITDVKNAPNATPWGEWSTAVYCPAGTYVSGYSMRVEPWQRRGDDTALNAVALYCSNFNYYYNISDRIVPHPGLWGNWGEEAHCPRGTYATAFKLKVERRQGGGDDTAANSLAFICTNPPVRPPLIDPGVSVVIEAPGGGGWGSWTSSWVTGPPNSAICGVKARFEDWQRGGDDTALNNLEFTWCQL